MKIIRFHIGQSPVEIPVRRLLIAGFTGRDLNSVKQHIIELEALGIRCPLTVPEFYEVEPDALTQARDIIAHGTAVSGEVEPVLILPTDHLEDALVAVASDLTDRRAERVSIAESKRMAKPISTEAWPYAQIAGRWDRLMLRSWTACDGRIQLYQEGTLEQLLRPDDLVNKLSEQEKTSLTGTVLFMGTIPLREQEFRFSNYFCGELAGAGGRHLRCEYSVSFLV